MDLKKKFFTLVNPSTKKKLNNVFKLLFFYRNLYFFNYSKSFYNFFILFLLKKWFFYPILYFNFFSFFFLFNLFLKKRSTSFFSNLKIMGLSRVFNFTIPETFEFNFLKNYEFLFSNINVFFKNATFSKSNLVFNQQLIWNTFFSINFLNFRTIDFKNKNDVNTTSLKLVLNKWSKLFQRGGSVFKFQKLFGRLANTILLTSHFLYFSLLSFLLMFNFPFNFYPKRYGKVYIQIPNVLKYWFYFFSSFTYLHGKKKAYFLNLTVNLFNIFFTSVFYTKVDNALDLFFRGFDRMRFRKNTYRRRKFLFFDTKRYSYRKKSSKFFLEQIFFLKKKRYFRFYQGIPKFHKQLKENKNKFINFYLAIPKSGELRHFRGDKNTCNNRKTIRI